MAEPVSRRRSPPQIDVSSMVRQVMEDRSIDAEERADILRILRPYSWQASQSGPKESASALADGIER